MLPLPKPPSKSDLAKVAFNFEPQSPAQKAAVKLWENKETRVLFLIGAAGVGKSHLAVALAIRDVLQGRAENVIVTRPIVESGRSMGYLPGDIDEKVAPYMTPILGVTRQIAYNVPDSIFVPMPLNFMRGNTFRNTVAILDEAQNCERKELRLFLSRIGKGARVIVTADPDQLDIRPTVDGYDTDFDSVVDDLEFLRGVGVVEFPDGHNLRDPLVDQILKRLR